MTVQLVLRPNASKLSDRQAGEVKDMNCKNRSERRCLCSLERVVRHLWTNGGG